LLVLQVAISAITAARPLRYSQSAVQLFMAPGGLNQETCQVFALLRLPSGSELLLNEIGKLAPPYSHGQALIRVRLDNGVLVEAVWDDYRHLFAVTGHEVQDDVKLKCLCERTTRNREWVPGVVNSLTWELAFTKAEACGTESEAPT
jgi:hypothetical protein